MRIDPKKWTRFGIACINISVLISRAPTELSGRKLKVDRFRVSAVFNPLGHKHVDLVPARRKKSAYDQNRQVSPSGEAEWPREPEPRSLRGRNTKRFYIEYRDPAAAEDNGGVSLQTECTLGDCFKIAPRRAVDYWLQSRSLRVCGNKAVTSDANQSCVALLRQPSSQRFAPEQTRLLEHVQNSRTSENTPERCSPLWSLTSISSASRGHASKSWRKEENSREAALFEGNKHESMTNSRLEFNS